MKPLLIGFHPTPSRKNTLKKTYTHPAIMDPPTSPATISTHVALLPWLAFGHMIPFHHLGTSLAAAGIRVSFISTPRNIARLPIVPDHLTALFTYVSLPRPPVPGLDPLIECTNDTSKLSEYALLFKSFDLLEHPVRQFLSDSSPDCLIFDFLAGRWATTVARETGVRSVCFCANAASPLTVFGPPESLTEEGRRRWPRTAAKPEWVTFPSPVCFGKTLDSDFFYSRIFFNVSETDVSVADRYGAAIERCDAVAVRSVHEYEGEYIELLESLYGKPVIPVGVLPPPQVKTRTTEGGWVRTFKWLDDQEPGSVVFVNFGSEVRLSVTQLHELAHGLEISGVSFLWALRKHDVVQGGEEALPDGFEERTRGRGVVVLGWAPQVEILAHPALGGTLNHSGWGSLIEAFCYGKLVVGLPTIFDQGLTARLAVEHGAEMEVERNEDGSFNREKIATALRAAMGDTEVGKRMRRRARELGVAVFGDRELNEKYVKGFAEFLAAMKPISKK